MNLTSSESEGDTADEVHDPDYHVHASEGDDDLEEAHDQDCHEVDVLPGVEDSQKSRKSMPLVISCNICARVVYHDKKFDEQCVVTPCNHYYHHFCILVHCSKPDSTFCPFPILRRTCGRNG